MKIYLGGYKTNIGVVSAETEQEAVNKLRIKLNIGYLDVIAEEVLDVPVDNLASCPECAMKDIVISQLNDEFSRVDQENKLLSEEITRLTFMLETNSVIEPGPIIETPVISDPVVPDLSGGEI